MPQEKKSFLLRIDPLLWAELERWAASELRSINNQIEFILRNAVARHKGHKEGSVAGSRGQASSASHLPLVTSPDPASAFPSDINRKGNLQ